MIFWGFSRHCSLLQRFFPTSRKPQNIAIQQRCKQQKNWVTKLNLSVKHLEHNTNLSFMFIRWKYLLTCSRWFLSFRWNVTIVQPFASLKVKSWPPKAPDLKTGRAPSRRPRLSNDAWWWSILVWIKILIKPSVFFVASFFGLNKFFPPVFRLGNSWAFISSGQQPSEPRCRNPAAKVAQGPLKEWSWEPSLVHAIPNWKKGDVRIKNYDLLEDKLKIWTVCNKDLGI